MPRINCYLPIKLCITGRLNDTQLEQLPESLVRAISARIAFAEQQIAQGNGGHSGTTDVEIVREDYNPDRAETTTGSYQVPSYQGGGQRVSMRLQGNARRRPWFIRNAVYFHARVGKFLDFMESLNPDESAHRLIYMDIYDQRRRAFAWLVQVNEIYSWSELQDILAQRANTLARVGSGQILAWGTNTTERARRKLIAIDEDGVVAGEIPSLANRNLRRVFQDEDDVFLLPGTWVLFAGMVLPNVETGDIVSINPEEFVQLPLHALDFIVNDQSFERLFGVSWNDHLNQFGDQLAQLRFLPFVTLRRVHFNTLISLIEPIVAYSVDSDSAYFGGLVLLNQSRLGWLPPAARPLARRLSDSSTLLIDELRREGWWEPGWHGAFVYAVVNARGQQAFDPVAERAGRQEPAETPARLISRFTSRGDLDEEGLGTYLVGLIRSSPALSHYVQRVIDELDNGDTDDVSLEFMRHALLGDLDSLAQSPNGRLLLVRLYDELTSGELDQSEAQQAQRLLEARVRARSIEVVARRLQTARGYIFPYRQGGPTVLDDSPITAERLPDGRIRVQLMTRVAGTGMFRDEVRTLPDSVFAGGLILDADEWIQVKLYDEGGIIVRQPALYLLQISNQGITRTLHTIANVTFTVASLGAGGAVAGASWGARVLLALDRAATVLSVVAILVNDHRGWLIQKFGENGRRFIGAVETANAVAGIYGIGRLAFATPRLVMNLRNSWRSWRASRAYRSLDPAELRQAEELSRNVENFLNSADEAAANAQREAGPTGASTSGEPPAGTPPEPPGNLPPTTPVAGAGTTQRVVLFRGTTYRFFRGRSRNIHDLGDGVYMTLDADLAVLYAQERRVLNAVDDPGAPGIVIRAEAEQAELGRVFDFYNNRALRSDWETFVARQPGGDVVLRGGPAEMYNGHFENWLRSRGNSLDDFDVIIGPEYIRGGSQACIRNQRIADRLLDRAEEWARAHDPVAPSYPDVPAPRVPSE